MNESTSSQFRELLAENRALRERLGDLRVALARLCGYHELDGQIPVVKIEDLLDQVAAS